MTWPGGSNAVGKANWSPLKGRDVTLWRDADAAGRNAIDQVRRALDMVGVARIRNVELPNQLPEDGISPIRSQMVWTRRTDQGRNACAATAFTTAWLLLTPRGLVWREEVRMTTNY